VRLHGSQEGRDGGAGSAEGDVCAFDARSLIELGVPRSFADEVALPLQ